MIAKRGQVTIFLVIGIILLFSFAGIFYLISYFGKSSLLYEKEMTEESLIEVKSVINPYIESCIEEVTIPAVYLLAINGGLIYPDEDTQILFTDYGMVNYAWLNGVNGFSKEKMEKDLAYYLERYFYTCPEFSIFNDQGLTVEADYDRIQADFIIHDNMIVVNLKLPLEITSTAGDSTKLNIFSYDIASNLGSMINTAEEIVINHQ